MELKGVCHPIQTEYAERIYNKNKYIFVGRSFLGKVKEGDKFILYESHGEKAYTGWADIKAIGKAKPKTLIKKYKNKMMITSEELMEYAKGKDKMTYIEFENFEKFKEPIKPGIQILVSGRYIYEEEFKNIENKKK